MSNNSRQTQFSCRQNHGSSQNPGLSHHAQDLSRQQQQHQHRRTYDRHRDKLFTFLMVDLHQDIRVSSFIPGALTQRFLVGIALIRHISILTQRRRLTSANVLF